MSVKPARVSGKLTVYADTAVEAEAQALTAIWKVAPEKFTWEMSGRAIQFANGDVITHEWRVAWEAS